MSGHKRGVEKCWEIDMGTFYIRCKIENIANRTQAVIVPKLLVDTDSEHTWIP